MRVVLRIAIGTFAGILCAGLLAQPEFARPKSARSRKQPSLIARAAPSAMKPLRPAPQAETGQAIVVLRTRDHRITVFSTGGQDLRYSVATPEGFALAEGLSADALRDRFPQLLDIVTGIAWAGL
jgi:hypothetical protein